MAARGSWALWAMVVFLLFIFFSGFSSAPPPSERAIGYTALGLWLFVPWAYWIDRHRDLREAGSGARDAGRAALPA